MSSTDTPDQSDTTSMYEQDFDGTPSEAVVSTVAGATAQSPLEMQPLFEVIDPDALDRLLGEGGEPNSSMRITFRYCGYRITVTPNRIQLVQPD